MSWFLATLAAALTGALLEAARRLRSSRNALTTAVAQARREMIEAAPESVLYCDSDDRVVTWNAGYAQLLGPVRPLLVVGQPFRTLMEALVESSWVGATAEERSAWVARRMAARAAFSGSWEQKLADDRWIQFHDLPTASGGTLLVCIDITDVKRREASLRLMFDQSPIPMWTWDPDALIFTDSNQAAQELFGWSAEEFKGLPVTDTIPDEERVAVRTLLSQGLPERYDSDRPWRHLRKDGSEVLIRSYSRRLPGSIQRQLLTAVVDVGDQVRSEQLLRSQAEALREASTRAEAASLAKSEFLANMSHEIRTPLNGVVAIADVLSRSTMTRDQSEMVELIRTSGETLNGLLSDILDLARIESGRFEIEPRSFDLERAVRSVTGVLELRANDKGVGFEVYFDPALSGSFMGDEVRVKQIISNLLSNAVKFTSQGAVRLDVRQGQNPDIVTIRVEDTGVGFDEDVRQRLFQRFQQADGSITRRFGGSGLGLSICRELTLAMGGEIGCDSQVGVGSAFYASLRLPRTDSLKVEQPFAQDVPSHCIRVLLADDHPTNQRVVQLVLAQVDADLVVVGDGEQALQAFMRQPFDLVLMDMQMPARDGLSATRAIRAFEAAQGLSRTPLVMLTANASSEHLAVSLAAGADRHLAKPFTAAGLLDLAAELVASEPAAPERPEGQIMVA